jgi:hypothetical protein
MLADKMPRFRVKETPGEHKSFALIEPNSVPSMRLKNEPLIAPVASVVCDDCGHLHCDVCEESSAARQFSDFWICHRCGELNRRA